MKEIYKEENEHKIIEILPDEVVKAMRVEDREDYYKKLTTEQYESLEIVGGKSITCPHDYLLKSYNKRKEWVEKTIKNSFDEYCIGLANIALTDRQFEEQKVPRALDMMGSYLLKSRDIESPRKIEDTFHIAEEDFLKTKISKESTVIDVSSGVFDISRQKETSLDIGRIKELLNVHNMNFDEKKKLVTKGLPFKDEEDSDLCVFMKELYFDICSNLQKEDDKIILDLMISGVSEEDISNNLGTTRQNINKKIKRIISNIGS